MPRPRNLLKTREIASIKDDGWYKDGGNLFLRVSNGNTRRRWIFRFRRGDKVTEIGLGREDEHTNPLAEVRDRRDQLLKQVERGLDPLAERRRNEHLQENRKTFAEVASLVIERQVESGRGQSSLDSWRHSFYEHCKKIAKLDVAEISTADLKDVVMPLIKDGYHSTAMRTLRRIEDVLGYAKAHEWRTKDNVASWVNIKSVVPERPNGNHHHPMLPYAAAPDVVQALREIETMGARLLEFTMLTAVRSSEAGGAKWSEFDFETAIWEVPAERMKRRTLFKVPLSDQVVAILEELKTHRRTGGRVFTVGRHAVWRVCKRVTGMASVHGMRATFRSWCADHGIDDGVAEGCLSHGPGDATRAAYNRGEMVDRRRVVMQAWADFLDGKHAANVVQLKRA
jgi:integrase